MIKSVVLVLSEEAARTVRYGVDNMTKKAQGEIGPKIIAEIDAQLKTKGNSSERSPIGFDDYDQIAANMGDEWPGPRGSERVTVAKPKRQTKAEKIADEMAKATREAVE